MIRRWYRHLLTTPGHVRRAFPAPVLHTLTTAIQQSEATHAGEIRFVVEGALSPVALWQGQSARARAIDLFADLRVWDTEHNNGVLIYLLLAEQDIEIVADRGIAAHVSHADWEDVCRTMETLLRQGQFDQALLTGIAAIGSHLQRHYPCLPTATNELSDTPLIL